MFAYLASTCDNLLSSANHLSYINNEIVGENGILSVKNPTFHFKVSALDNFEFHISSGIKPTMPVLWKPNEQDLIQYIHGNNNGLRIKRLSPDVILPTRCTSDSTGNDVSTSQPTTVPAHSTTAVPLGFAMAFSLSLKSDL